MPLAAPRTWVVGETVTAALMNAEIRDQISALRADNLYARKTSATSRNTTTTRTDDPHLTISVVASAVYIVDGLVLYSATTTADLSIAWSVPSGATGAWTAWCVGLGATGSTSDGYLIRTDGRTDLTQAHTCAGIDSPNITTVQVRATLVTSASAGSLALSWAQSTSGAVDTTLYANSWIRAVRIS